MNEYATRQLGALSAVALAAPVLIACSAVSWQLLLAAMGIATLYYIYIVWAVGGIAPQVGFARLAVDVYGRVGGKILLGLYWAWIALAAARAGRLAAASFPLAEGFFFILITLAALGAWLAAKGTSAVCRFGSILFFFLFAMLAIILGFGAADATFENLRPSGAWRDALGPLAVFLLPTMGLFLRGEATGKQGYSRWFFLLGALALACSLVTRGTLGPVLAARVTLPFHYMSKSISILGVMERFEAVVSALMLISFATLSAYFVTMGRKITESFTPAAPIWASCGLPALAMVALGWVVPALPNWVWLAGDSLFWGLLPALTLGVAHVKKM